MRVPEEWRETTLGQVTDIVGGSTPSKNEPTFWDNGIIAWATPSDITKLTIGQLRISNTSAKVTEAAVRDTSLRIMPPGTVIMTSRATIGYPAINTVPLTTNQGFANFLPGTNHDPDFLAQWIIYMRPILERNAGGSTFLEISKKTLRNVSIPEQRRIAEILSSVDEAIAATQAVIEQTRLVKQGVLKRLLTKGIGHTHFKQTEIGEIPEAWEVLALGSIAAFQPGYPFKSQEFSDTGDRLLRGSNVGVGELIWGDSNTKFFPEIKRREFQDFTLNDGDIVLAMDRPFISSGFKVARVSKDDLPALLLQRVGRFNASGQCNEDWLWQVVSSGTLKETLERRQVGTDLPHISKSDIESCVVAVPPKEEQIQISIMMQEFDAALHASKAQALSYAAIKSALLSDLLTGRKRVPLADPSPLNGPP
jgi:type I restriction enzyme S subunit